MNQTKTVSAVEMFQKIREEGQRLAKPAPGMRFLRVAEKGAGVRQGDIYLWTIDAVPAGSARRDDRQLALGQSVGSRHVCQPGPKLFDLPTGKTDEFLGPVIEADARFVVEHPEHDHLSLPSGIWQVGYQRDVSTNLRVHD
jgi:hypothetical protein